MRLVSFFIGFAGLLLLLLGTIWFLIEAFSEDFLWGLGCLFIPILQWVFLIGHWDRAKKGFLLQLAGGGLLFLSAVMAK